MLARLAIGTALATAACGGGSPLLHPAHPLPAAKVSAGAGVSGQFAYGPIASDIDAGRSASAQEVPTGSEEERTLVDGAVAEFMIKPGVAPYVGGRVGLGHDVEAGLAYLGRTVRADARYAFVNGSWAVSAGAGLSLVLVRITSDPEPGVPETREGGRVSGGVNSLAGSGLGFDIPLLIGWRSSGEVLQFWAGPRGGFEGVRGDLPLNQDSIAPLGSPGSADAAPVRSKRWHAGGLFGLMVGMNPIWVALEVNAAYQSVGATVEFPAGSGEPELIEVQVAGVTVSPAAAIIGKF